MRPKQVTSQNARTSNQAISRVASYTYLPPEPVLFSFKVHARFLLCWSYLSRFVCDWECFLGTESETSDFFLPWRPTIRRTSPNWLHDRRGISTRFPIGSIHFKGGWWEVVGTLLLEASSRIRQPAPTNSASQCSPARPEDVGRTWKASGQCGECFSIITTWKVGGEGGCESPGRRKPLPRAPKTYPPAPVDAMCCTCVNIAAAKSRSVLF